MKKNRLLFVIIQISILFTAFQVFAVDEASGPSYSLGDLCRAANKNAERIHIAADDVNIAKEEKNRALSVLIPRATAFGSYLNRRQDEANNPDSLTLGVKLTQSFTINGKELTAYEYSKKGIEKSRFALESIRADYLFQVAQSYFQTLSAKRQKEIAAADVERLKTHRNSVQEKLSVGNVTKTDLFRAEAELSKARTSMVTADHGVLQGKANIARLVGIDTGFTVSGDDVEDLGNFNPVLEKIQVLALENRNEVKEAQKDLERAMDNLKYEKGDYWPSLSLEAGYKESDLSYEAAPSDVEYDTEEAYVQAELSFTLYDGGLRGAQVRQALARERQAKQALESTKNQIILESRVAFLEFQTARTTLANLQDELKSARENFNAVQMQFKYGMADSIDMMDANTLLVTAERRISDAEYTLSLAGLKILYTKNDLVDYLLN
ncbi:TolC family protein [Desulfospira joergensenii]|uniref:TolC family protein n=1 Tax=Desulfospira joergensenii TaxID=53329 RepID=UPI0004869880|nr:TolC family protein [Desulfospira joergensenii]